MALVLVGAGLTIYSSLKPGQEEFVQTEVNISELATTEEIAIYEDWAGFRFEYPQQLKVEEIELDDKTVYSSLEIAGLKDKKIGLRISDTKYEDIDQWQEEFETGNVIIEIKDIYWVDMPGRQLSYGAPQKLLSVTVDEQVIYILESPADRGGFWDKTHQMILNSFEFTGEAEPAEQKQEVDSPAEEEADIILLDEQVIE